MKESNPGSRIKVDLDEDGNFKALYMCMQQQSDMTHSCMHISSLDGGHLKNILWGNYVVLLICSYDGENELCVLAMAIVRGETKVGYETLLDFFLDDPQCSEWMSREDSIIITDRGTAIVSAINEIIRRKLPHTHLRNCCRHLFQNFKGAKMTPRELMGYGLC